jgi:uncharacterized membrane protein YjjP (DUF1212 family)
VTTANVENPAPPAKDTGVLLELLYRLGQAYLACGEQTAQVELLLRRIASAHGMRKSRVVAFPSAIFISVHDETGERVTLAEGPLGPLRLDQIADVYTLGEAARRLERTPAEALEILTAIMKKPPRYGTIGVIVGHIVLSVGLSMMLMPTLANFATAAVLGGVVGAAKAIKRGSEVLAVPLSVVAAVLVSALVFLAVRYGLPVDPLHALVPPLVTFLPGAMLAMGMVELAYGDMVSGTSRLVNGFVQLVLLAFGLAAGAALIGVDAATMYETQTTMTPWVPWLPWLGVAIFGVGIHTHFSAPRNSLGWMLLVLLMTFTAQRLSTGIVGSEFSGFFGALVATPLVYLIQLRFKGPPAMVTFLPSFWLLVPGALGLMSVKRMLSDRGAGLEGLTTAVFVFASIALGTLMGASLYKSITEALGTWQLQIGRSTKRVSTTPAKKIAKPAKAAREPDPLAAEEAENESDPVNG